MADDRLRDIFFIWIYATATPNILKKIRNGEISEDVLVHELGRHITVRDKSNAETTNASVARAVHKLIMAHGDDFWFMSSLLRSIPEFVALWPSSQAPVHPGGRQIRSILNFLPAKDVNLDLQADSKNMRTTNGEPQTTNKQLRDALFIWLYAIAAEPPAGETQTVLDKIHGKTFSENQFIDELSQYIPDIKSKEANGDESKSASSARALHQFIKLRFGFYSDIKEQLSNILDAASPWPSTSGPYHPTGGEIKLTFNF